MVGSGEKILKWRSICTCSGEKLKSFKFNYFIHGKGCKLREYGYNYWR